jgi:hypothetical protein
VGIVELQDRRKFRKLGLRRQLAVLPPAVGGLRNSKRRRDETLLDAATLPELSKDVTELAVQGRERLYARVIVHIASPSGALPIPSC